jgi:DNA-binding PadR family transcriptional regulator
MGGATAERGGRRKRIFEATAQGKEVITEIKVSRQKLWSLIADLS